MKTKPDKTKKGKTLVYYLASAYSTPVDIEGYKQRRYEQVEAIAVELMQLGYVLIEPIASSHPKSLRHNLPQTFDYWKYRDLALIDASDGIIIAGDIPEWTKSVGVTAELVHAYKNNKPVFLYRAGKFEVTNGNKKEDN